jgi:Nif-specific regulatory protein
MNSLLDTRSSLEALSAIAETINTLHEPDELLEKVLEIAMESLGAERGFILLSDRQAPNGFAVRSTRNLNEEQVGEIVRISTSVVQSVLASGEPVLSYEALHDERFRETESIVLERIQSIACVPLRIKARPIGAIYLDSVSRRSRFTRESLPFLTAFANQAAVAIENARLYSALRQENRTLREGVRRAHGFDGIIGQSPRMQEVFDLMTRVAESDATVLLEGESGTGKELVARALHYTGDRRNKPFMAIFCGSLPENLLESELFGHKKGSFTGAAVDKRGLFEAADGGTVFLDEVGDLTPTIQLALLRVLQEGEIKRVGETQTRKVDIRVISATNRPLTGLVKSGSFREDLYYRLNTISITLPPLRSRRSDIPALAHHFLDLYAKGKRAHIKGFTPDAVRMMEAYAWPGNVRELQNTVERAVVLTRSEVIEPADLRLTPGDRRDPFEAGLPLREVERRAVMNALDENEGNVSETARVLGVSRRWLHYKLKEWEAPES